MLKGKINIPKQKVCPYRLFGYGKCLGDKCHFWTKLNQPDESVVEDCIIYLGNLNSICRGK